MIRFVSLGSGSSGNAFVVKTETATVMLDCGIAIRRCQSALRELGVVNPPSAIAISHEHIDHVRALPPFVRRRETPVLTTAGTVAALDCGMSWQRAEYGARFQYGDIEVTFVQVSHDAAQPSGFAVDVQGVRIAVFTDLGHVTPEVLDVLATADHIVLESNYDPFMLRRGGYPAHLKRRISGPAGHLSNDDCAGALAATVSDRTRSVWLAHLSENNNLPAIARTTVSEALTLAGHEIPVRVLSRHGVSEILGPSRDVVQLAFAADNDTRN